MRLHARGQRLQADFKLAQLAHFIGGDVSGSGSVLQTVSLLGDGHDVGNQLRITLVQPSTGAALQLQQNVALSLGLLQGLRSGR